ncbi:hypothetical protein BaRGS_00000538, partial [Batillaria attramentaria]
PLEKRPDDRKGEFLVRTRGDLIPTNDIRPTISRTWLLPLRGSPATAGSCICQFSPIMNVRAVLITADPPSVLYGQE